MLNYLNNTNRPWNITNVTVRPRGARQRRALPPFRHSLTRPAAQDALQPTGFKKPRIQRALDTLAETGRCLCTARGRRATLGALLMRLGARAETLRTA